LLKHFPAFITRESFGHGFAEGVEVLLRMRGNR
jgi:hypothetical protein